MPHSHRPLSCLALLLCACTPSSRSSPPERFAGRWYYRHPEPASGQGIARLRCPATADAPSLDLPLPQIGWIDLRPDDASALVGTTDQGCTWSFTIEGDTARLGSSTQTCFNRNIGSSYTIFDWSLTLEPDGVMQELLHAVSHQAVDCDFELARGTREKETDTPGDRTKPFLGTWRPDAPDASGANVALLSCSAGEGGTAAGPPSYLPQTGTFLIARLDDDTVAVTTSAGCTSTLHVVGHTAELASAPASCAEGPVPTFWSFETQGDDAFQIVSGVMHGCLFALSNSHLAREVSP